VWRLTATLSLLWAARRIVFAVVGEAKAGVVAEVIDGAIAHPAQRVAAGAGDVTWLLDAAAASQLRKHGT
jgi:6-phosphogluconolactonase/glucosamine-6-phosphate isomerase/deaminase